MTPAQIEAIELAKKLRAKINYVRDEIAAIHRGARAREAASHGEPFQKQAPRPFLSELNSMGRPALDGMAQLQLMRHARQLQPDHDHRFSAAMGKTDWPGQREWESGAIDTREQFDGSGAWYRPKPAGRTAGAPIYDDTSEHTRHPALPVSSTSEQHWSDGEKVTDAEALRRKAYAQIVEILNNQKARSARLSSFNMQ